jgi:hypothetical protein
VCTGALSPEVKRPGREAEHSGPSTAEVKNVWSYTSTPPVHLNCVVLNETVRASSWRGTWLSTGTALRLPLPSRCTHFVGNFEESFTSHSAMPYLIFDTFLSRNEEKHGVLLRKIGLEVNIKLRQVCPCA